MYKILLLILTLLCVNISAHAKQIGIMGGMGPDATIDAQRILLDYYKSNGAEKDQDYPNFMVSFLPQTPDRTAYLLKSETNKSPLPYLVRSLQKLENAGSDIIFMTCNTAHAFVDELEKVKKPTTKIINMIEETAKFLKSYKPERILLLATDGTLKTGIYQKYFGKNIVHPKIGSKEQETIMDIIYGKYGIKAGYLATDKRLPQDKTPWAKLQQVIKSFDNIDKIILGCTELPLAVPINKDSAIFVNPVKVAVKQAILSTR